MANFERSQNTSSQELMDEVYSPYWQEVKGHGPNDARLALLKRARTTLMSLSPDEWVLDLGAGRQILERQWNSWAEKPEFKTATIDIAHLKPKQLLRRSSDVVHHARGDGAELPYRNGAFSVAVSSMGLELMPTEAIPELSRVLKTGGKAFINVLHPSISEWKKDALAKFHTEKKSDKRARAFWEYYARSNVFSKGDANIRYVFEEFGLHVDRIETAASRNDHSTWIEIDVTKAGVRENSALKEHILTMGEIDLLNPNYAYDQAVDVAKNTENKIWWRSGF